MTETIDLYFSFRSPFSALAMRDYQALAAEMDVTIRARPVLPLAVRQADFFRPENRPWMNYVRMDALRRAEQLERVLVMPEPDPIVIDLSTMIVSREQPHIHRLTRLGVEAARRGRGLAFAAELSGLIFGGTRDWHLGTHVAQAAGRSGLDLADMEAAIAAGDHDAEIDANQRALVEAGHWGVPTAVVRGEPFFGQDRVETLRWRLGTLGCGLSDT